MQSEDRTYAKRATRIKSKIYSNGTTYLSPTARGAANMLVRIEAQSPFLYQTPTGAVVSESCCDSAPPPPPGVSATVYSADGTSTGTAFRELEGGSGSLSDAYVVKYSDAGAAVWAARIIGINGADVLSVRADAAGNCYVAGIYHSTLVSFYNATVPDVLTKTLSGSGNDIFIAKYTSVGEPVWVARIADIGNGVAVVDIACTADGDVFVSGLYKSASIKLYSAGASSSSMTLPNTSDSTGFLAKFNTTGIYQWVVSLGLTAVNKNTSCEGLVVSSDNTSVYVTGSYSADLTFGTTGASIAPLVKSGASVSNGYIAKYSTSGVPQWAARIAGNTTTKSESGITITESSGDVYVGGYYTGMSATVYSSGIGSSVTLPGITNGSCMFLAKYNSSGVVQWATHMDSFASPIPGIPSSNLNGLSVVGSTVYATGVFLRPSLFVYSTGFPLPPPIIKTTSNLVDAFVVAYSTAGAAQWCNTLTKTSTDITNVNYGYGITGTTAVGSYLSRPLVIGGLTSNKELTNSGIADSYIVRYTSTGEIDWRTRIAGTLAEAATGVAQTTGGMYVVGLYSGNPDIFDVISAVLNMIR